MEEFRAVVKHFYLKKWTVAQIKVELGEVHGDTETTLKTIYFLINELTRDRKSTKDEARPGRPVTATAPEMIETIHRIVMEDHREMLCKTSKPFAQKTANGTSEIGAQKILFHQDNAEVSMAKVHELGFKLLPHPPCSLDLALKPHDLARGKGIFVRCILNALKPPTFPRG